jgi:asparagine synthase (glutamine-hydrolysing)
VALSGDGGDELFGGYDRYLITAGLWDKIAGIPRPLRVVAAKALTMVPAGAWTRLGDTAGGLLPRTIRLKRLGDKVHKGADMLCSDSLDSLYDDMLSLWRDPDLVIGAPQRHSSQFAGAELLGELGGVERMMACDMLGYLTNDILVKVDRAAMAVSLETRVPLLDPELVEFAWRVPLDMKIRGGTTKWLLRKVLYRHVPEKLIDRPKMGFGIPLDSWLRGPLREWAEALLDEQKLSEQGLFSAGQIRSTWDAHLRGYNNQSKLWTILMFQSWFEVSAKHVAPPTAPTLDRVSI